MYDKNLDGCLGQAVKVVKEYELDEWYHVAYHQADVTITKETCLLMPYDSRNIKGSLVFQRDGVPVFVEKSTWQLIRQISQQQVDDYDTQRQLFYLMSGKQIKKQPFLHHQHGIWLPLTGPSQYPSVWLNFDQFFSFLNVAKEEGPYRLGIQFNGEYRCYLDTSYRGFHQRLVHVRDVCDVFSLFFDYLIESMSLHHLTVDSPLDEEAREYIAQHGGNKKPTVVCQSMKEAMVFFSCRP